MQPEAYDWNKDEDEVLPIDELVKELDESQRYTNTSWLNWKRNGAPNGTILPTRMLRNKTNKPVTGSTRSAIQWFLARADLISAYKKPNYHGNKAPIAFDTTGLIEGLKKAFPTDLPRDSEVLTLLREIDRKLGVMIKQAEHTADLLIEITPQAKKADDLWSMPTTQTTKQA